LHEPYACIEVAKNGFTGQDVYINEKAGDLISSTIIQTPNSSRIAKITMLRQMAMADNGVVFVTRLDEEKDQTLTGDPK